MKRILPIAVAGVRACTCRLSAWQVPLPEKLPSGVRGPSLVESYPNFVVRDGNAARLERVFAKGLRGEPIVVAVIGGSITSGARAASRDLLWGCVLVD